MKEHYRLFQRAGGVFYLEDKQTGKQSSLKTKDRKVAARLLLAHNEAHQQPELNLQIARAYLVGSDPLFASRTWQMVMDAMVALKGAATKPRWLTATRDKAFTKLRHKPLLGTKSEDLLTALQTGTVSTNVYLRRIHNFALDMDWLPKQIIPRRQWPKIVHKSRRAITWPEHRQIIAREGNLERNRFYQLCWHLGGAQKDVASLHGEDVDWAEKVVTYNRRKTTELSQMKLGPQALALLATLPKAGPLFPYLVTLRSNDRATEFKQRCDGLGIKGVSLHSYRYAWAERAKQCGYPERFAQLALGHGSKAMHRAYARKAQVTVPSLEEYEAEMHEKVIKLPASGDDAVTGQESASGFGGS